MLCKQAGLPFSPPSGPQAASFFWAEKAKELLYDAAEELGVKFDAVVVDEAQDFQLDRVSRSDGSSRSGSSRSPASL